MWPCDWELAKSGPAFKREFYTPPASVTKMTAAAIEARREELGVTLEVCLD